MSAIRPTYVAADRGGFYPESEERCRRLLAQCLEDAKRTTPAGEVLGGIVPHAGWVYSGSTAASTFVHLPTAGIETVVLFGAVHLPGVERAALWQDGAWQTPLGAIEIDRELASAVLGDEVIADRQAHEGEHAIEVELPFCKQLLPDVKLLPISVPADEQAAAVGRRVAREAQRLGRRAIALGSTDLTHYGERFGFAPRGTGQAAHDWVMQTNDRELIEAIEALDSEAVLDQARRNRSACGAGAINATMAYVAAHGASRGQLVRHTSSQEVRPEPHSDSFVGYASLLFC